MPRKSKVPAHQVLSAIAKYRDNILFCGRIPVPSHAIYSRIVEDLNYQVSAKALYNFLRRNVSEILPELHNPEEKPIALQVSPSDDEVEESKSSDNNKESNSSDTDCLKFDVDVGEEIWKLIKPISVFTTRNEKARPHIKFRRRTVLPKGQWTHVLNDLLFQNKKLPCTWIFRTGTGNIFCEAKCKQCGAILIIGQVQDEDQSNIKMHCKVYDYDEKVKHDSAIKRKLSGIKRLKVAEGLQQMSASSYRRGLANELMQFGDQEPPHIHSEQIYRQAKYEANLEKRVHSNPMLAIWSLKYTLPYVSSIHNCGLDPFFVHYWTPAQVQLYKSYGSKNYTVLSIDATGSLIKPLIPDPKPVAFKKSKHTFLYAGVLSVSCGPAVPVIQMLSQAHDTVSLSDWFQKWLSHTRRKPNEVRTDDSAALIKAVTSVFADQTSVNSYVESCYASLTKKEVIPTCFVRMDRNHFIKAVTRWKCFINKDKRIKKMYCHCIGLLTDLTDLQNIKYIVAQVLFIALSAYDNMATKTAKREIMQFISRGQVQNTDVQEQDDELQRYDDSVLESGQAESEVSWFSEVIDTVQAKLQLVENSKEDNLFSLPEIVPPLQRICHKLPIWSAIMVPLFGAQKKSTTSYIESYFKDLKSSTFHNNTPISADMFIMKHIGALEGHLKLSASKLLEGSTSRKELFTSTKEDEKYMGQTSFPAESIFQKRPREEENWMGKNKPSKLRKVTSSYFSLQEGWSFREEIPKNMGMPGILKNGSILPGVKFNSEKYMLENTCPFDSVVQGLAFLCSYSPNFKRIINDGRESNTLFDLINKLNLNSMAECYLLRLKLLFSVFEPIQLKGGIKKINCACNVAFIIEKCIKDSLTSVTVTSVCNVCNIEDTVKHAFVPLNYQILTLFGITSLDDSINVSYLLKHTKCHFLHNGKQCGGERQKTIQVGSVVFIEPYSLDINENFLTEVGCFPQNVTISGVKYQLKIVIEFKPPISSQAIGHYVSHVKTPSGNFNCIDDLRDKIMPSSGKILPHLLIYENDDSHP